MDPRTLFKHCYRSIHKAEKKPPKGSRAEGERMKSEEELNIAINNYLEDHKINELLELVGYRIIEKIEEAEIE